MALFDYRAPHKGIFRKYKGCVGGVRGIDCLPNKPYFASVGLDRFLRVYNIAEPKPIQKMYLKSQLNCVLLTKDFDPCESVLDQMKLKKQIQDAKIKRASCGVIDPKPAKEGSDVEDSEEFWTKLKVIKSSSKSKERKKNVSEFDQTKPAKKRKL